MLIGIDGRELDFPQLDTLTFREAGLIKKVTGLKMGQFESAFEEGDTDMILALALVAKSRADGAVDTDALLDTVITNVEVIVEEGDEIEEADDGPPAEAVDAAADEPAAS